MSTKTFILKIISDIFIISVISLVVFITADVIKPGFVTSYLNLNLFLLWTIIIGVAELMLSDSKILILKS